MRTVFSTSLVGSRCLASLAGIVVGPHAASWNAHTSRRQHLAQRTNTEKKENEEVLHFVCVSPQLFSSFVKSRAPSRTFQYKEKMTEFPECTVFMILLGAPASVEFMTQRYFRKSVKSVY